MGRGLTGKGLKREHVMHKQKTLRGIFLFAKLYLFHLGFKTGCLQQTIGLFMIDLLHNNLQFFIKGYEVKHVAILTTYA